MRRKGCSQSASVLSVCLGLVSELESLSVAVAEALAVPSLPSWQSLGCRCTALIIAANDALKGSRRRQAVACQQQQQQQQEEQQQH